MADNNVFILFEEIKTALKGINGKLEALPKVAGQQPQIENNEPDLSPIKEAIVETAKAQSGEIKGLLDKHWKAYAQISILILHHLDTIKKSQDEQGVQQEPQPQEQSNRKYSDDALRFRAIRSWGGCDANDLLWLNKVFDIHRDEKAIEWIRKQADGYETSLKAVSDSLMQESIKSKSD